MKLLMIHVWNEKERAYRHCAEFKKRGIYTVCSGYHATALPDEAARLPLCIGKPVLISLALTKSFHNGFLGSKVMYHKRQKNAKQEKYRYD